LDYPLELKKEAVAARFRLGIFLDRDGSVRRASVWNSHYPNLEKQIVDEALKWKFEPFVHRGEAIRAFGFVTIVFFPNIVTPQITEAGLNDSIVGKDTVTDRSRDLGAVLEACADYCERLSDYALYYVCIEKIDEMVKEFTDANGIAVAMTSLDLRPTEYMVSKSSFLQLKEAEKDSFLYDYQLIRGDGKIKEERILLGSTDVKKDDKDTFLGTKLSHSLQPILVPAYLLSNERQHLFSYSLGKDEKVKGRKSYVIEVLPLSNERTEVIYGKVWVDKENKQILQIEMEASFLNGYEEIYEECSKHYLSPRFKITHLYEVEKNDILFPSQSEISISYFGLLTSKEELKSEIDIKYSSYRFFTVDVDHNIIKKLMEEFFSTYENKLPFKFSLKALPNFIK